MKSVFEKLLKHCVEIYAEKTGRNGMPYILHPLAVMSKVESLPEKIVALAHDYGEFRDVEELAEIGVSEMLLDKIRLLAKTFPDDVPEDAPQYCDYIWALLADPICRKVKYADLLVNDGYEESPTGDGRRFTGQYPGVMNLLADAVEGKLYFRSKTLYFNVFSNFYPIELEIDGVHWKSAEHYYQAAKFSREFGVCSDDDAYEAICNAETARQAKEIADANFSEENRWQWSQALRRYVATTRMLNAKYAAGTFMRELLYKTGDLTLIHESKDDLFWGQNRAGEGHNVLGKALMQMRDSGSDCSVIEMIANAGEK